MMIRVTVELDQYGLGQRVTKLAEILIANDGTGTARHGNYDVQALNKKTGAAIRTARVERHARQAKPVSTLVRKALEALGY